MEQKQMTILAEAENRQKLNNPMENSVINGAGV